MSVIAQSPRVQSPADLLLRLDLARATTGDLTAVRLDVPGGPITWVVASPAEVAVGRVANDDRPRYQSIHAAFRAADLAVARRQRLEARAA